MVIQFKSLERDGLVHAVTTRAGGVSRGSLATLNMSWARPDDPATVVENRRRVCERLEIPIDRVVQAGQIHDIGVQVVQAEHAGRGAITRASILPPSDGLITDVEDIYLLACFADCVPLLFYDPGRPAVGVAHAGWRGTLLGMASAMVRAFEAEFGSAATDLRVVIGPSIGPCCYQVGPDVLNAAQWALPDRPGLFSHHEGDTAHLDLWQANRAFLEGAGVLPEHIQISGLCTMHHADQFFSHRATGGDTGRFAAIIGLRPRAAGMNHG